MHDSREICWECFEIELLINKQKTNPLRRRLWSRMSIRTQLAISSGHDQPRFNYYLQYFTFTLSFQLSVMKIKKLNTFTKHFCSKNEHCLVLCYTLTQLKSYFLSSTFRCLSGASSPLQMAKKGGPDVTIPSNAFQLLLEDSEAFPVQMRYIISPTWRVYSWVSYE